MAAPPEPGAQDATPQSTAILPIIVRFGNTAVGFSFGMALGCVLRVLPALSSVEPVTSIFGMGIAGGLFGAVVPIRVTSAVVALPHATPGRPVPVGALGAEFARLLERPSASGLLFGAAVAIGAVPAVILGSLLLGIRPPLALAVLVALCALVGATLMASVLPPFLLRTPVRRALVAHSWLGAREAERAFGTRHAFDGFPISPEEIGAWLRAHPEDDRLREVHVELHLMAGDWEAARAAIERMEERTPRGRYLRRILEAMLDYQMTGVADDRAARQAQAAMPPGQERIEAEVGLALFQARRRLPGHDWPEPLVEARRAIPESDTLVLLRDHGWVTLAALVRGAWVGLLLAIAAGIAVLALAAALRY